VIEEVGRFGEHRLAVRPPALRGVLVRDAFYKGVGRLDSTALVQHLRSDPHRVPGLAMSLLAARQRGGDISNDLLLDVASQANSDLVWRYLGYVDAALSESLLVQHPEAVSRAADGLLRSRPEANTSSSPPRRWRFLVGKDDPARRSIKEWLEGDEPGDSESIPRRRQLLDAMKDQMDKAAATAPALHEWAIALAMSPNVDAHRVPPGEGRTVVIYRGLRSLDQLQQIALLWPRVLVLCQEARIVSGNCGRTIEDWCFPGRHAQAGASEEMRTFARSMGSLMLTDLQKLPACGRACRSWISQTSVRAGLDVAVQVDRPFHRIFASREAAATDWQKQQQRREGILTRVAEQLIELGPEQALGALASWNARPLSSTGTNGSDRTFLYYRLAQSAADAIEWLDVAVRERLDPSHLKPFLDVAIRKDSDELRESLLSMLTDDDYARYRQLSCIAIISMAAPESDLLRQALDAVEINGHTGTFVLSIRAKRSHRSEIAPTRQV